MPRKKYLLEEEEFKEIEQPKELPATDELSAGLVFGEPEPLVAVNTEPPIKVPIPRSNLYGENAVRFCLAGSMRVRILRGTAYERTFDPKDGTFEERRDLYDLYLKPTGFFRGI